MPAFSCTTQIGQDGFVEKLEQLMQVGGEGALPGWKANICSGAHAHTHASVYAAFVFTYTRLPSLILSRILSPSCAPQVFFEHMAEEEHMMPELREAVGEARLKDLGARCGGDAWLPNLWQALVGLCVSAPMRAPRAWAPGGRGRPRFH